MKKLTVISILLTSLVFVAPVQVSAATGAGVKPGSFFYFFDTAFENVGLFFTFNSEQKAKRALEYADERLAEAEESANENNPKAIEKAMTGYKEEISFATEKSKELKDDERAEELLNIVSESTAKHQEVLKGVLEKVPKEAKEAILKAIEVSRKGQEEATKQIIKLKDEVERLKKEVEELKLKKESNDPQTDEVEKLKKEVETLKEKQKVILPTPKPPTPITQNSQEQKKLEEKPKTITLPNGAIVEMDVNGNIVRTVKEAPQQTYTAPVPTTQSQTAVTVQISLVNITPTISSARVEWQTDKPTESKIFLSGGGLSSKVYKSESGLSTRHLTTIIGLSEETSYSYEIEAIAGGIDVAKKLGSFETLSSPKDRTSPIILTGPTLTHTDEFRLTFTTNEPVLFKPQRSDMNPTDGRGTCLSEARTECSFRIDNFAYFCGANFEANKTFYCPLKIEDNSGNKTEVMVLFQ